MFLGRGIQAAASLFDEAGRIPVISTAVPKNSWDGTAKLHLAKFTDRPGIRNFEKYAAYGVEVFFPGGAGDKCIKPTDTGFLGQGISVFTILVKAAGRTVKPKPARLNALNCPSASRKAVLYICPS